MPPRYAYWTILVDDQPTAFRASAQEDLLPTLKRLQAKHASAKMMWWQNGKLWDSRHEAQDAMHMRGEMGRRNDSRQSAPGFRPREKKSYGDRDRKPFRDRSEGSARSAWTPRGQPSTRPPARDENNKLEWKPKGEFVPAPKRADREGREDRSDRSSRDDRPRSFDREKKSFSSEGRGWKSKDRFDGERKPFKSDRPEWKPKGSFSREERPRTFKRPSYKPSGDESRSAKPQWKPKGSFDRQDNPRSFDRERKPRAEGEKLEWKPKGESSEAPAKRKWVPKDEYKKSIGQEARRDKNWRPGGEHKDPRQKYKDAKKAKWTKFKKAVRTRWESKKKREE